MQENDFYTIAGKKNLENKYVYDVQLNPNAAVYAGHFPGNPVSPGVCNLRMIAGCAADALEKMLCIQKISRCRFLHLITPLTHARLSVELILDALDDKGCYPVSAKIYDGENVCVDFKGELSTTC